VRRIALIFVVAVFVPSLLLGFLALRTAHEQRNILERQLFELYRKDVDLLAEKLQVAILDRQRQFADRVRVMLSKNGPPRRAVDFAKMMEPDDGVAFMVTPGGSVMPARPDSRKTTGFLRENEAFLSNRATAEFFPTQQGETNSQQQIRMSAIEAPTIPQSPRQSAALQNNLISNNGFRTVQPQKSAAGPDDNSQVSRVAPLVSDFETATSSGTDGVLARYTQNALELILWTRPPEAKGYVFGLALPAGAAHDLVRQAFASIAPSPRDACIAVLDENARPVAVSRDGFQTNWKRPFVSSEIGEILPHWETSLYLLEPDQLARSARLITLTIVLFIAVALAAILAGGGFVALDARRQLLLAQKKTDFVSNVSHELKTPLTSIRMFAELLEQGRIDDPAKQSRYLRIIILETERLSRLINNVLDFARSGHKQRTYRKAKQDLSPVIDHVWESQSTHLRDAGFVCEREADGSPYPVDADTDAIEQVLVNLLSNAEKYSGSRHEVLLRSWRENGSVLVSVQDRGPGVPHGEEERIFEAFHRANDSLASGIQGSGLGLTLARRIARDHGGDIEYRPRDGGGSEFTLRLPVAGNGEFS
jgi:signal transduction histidine kinase